jgi:hypothetical protein
MCCSVAVLTRWFTDAGDLTGILVLRGVMDDTWLEQANIVLDRYKHDPARAWTATDVVAEREGACFAFFFPLHLLPFLSPGT